MKKILIGLHSLRGLAAISIVIFHTFGMHNLELPAEFLFIKQYFGLGVPLFFVISAFSLFLSTTARVGKDGWLSAFLIRRLMRVAPLFYFMIVVYCLYIPLKFDVFIPLRDVLLNISFLYNMFPGKHESIVWAGWTIGVEMMFYIFVPYLLVLVTRGWQSVILVVSLVTISTVFYELYQSSSYPQGYAYMSFMGSIGVFSYGVSAFFLYKRILNIPTETQRKAGKGLLFLSLIILGLIVSFEKEFTEFFGNRSNIWGLFFALLIVSQCIRPYSILSNKVFSYLGNLSFALYLCHPLVVYSLKPIFDTIYSLNIWNGFSFILCSALTLLIVIPVSIFVNILIERPGMKLGEWLINNKFTHDNVSIKNAGA